MNTFSRDSLRPDIGALWENWVIAEAAKKNVLTGSPAELYFWRSRAQSEVDLVIKIGDFIQGVEIKWSPRRVSGLAFRDMYGADVTTVYPGNPFVGDVVNFAAR